MVVDSAVVVGASSARRRSAAARIRIIAHPSIHPSVTPPSSTGHVRAVSAREGGVGGVGGARGARDGGRGRVVCAVRA